MSIFGKSEQKKKNKELKNELKQWKKQVLAAGGEKTEISQMFKDFENTLELAETLYLEYKAAKEHLFFAREAIERLLEYMAESPVQEVKESLGAILTDLELIYHDCSIQREDMDFQSTMNSLKTLTAEYGSQGRMTDIMLRSELENVKAVLDDAAGWNPPEFAALAYYFSKEGKEEVRDMESGQRNLFVLHYFNEHFMNPFLAELEKAGQRERVPVLMREYVYGEENTSETE